MVGFPHNSFRDNVGNHDAQFSKWKSNPGEISYLGLHMRKKKKSQQNYGTCKVHDLVLDLSGQFCSIYHRDNDTWLLLV